LLSFSVNEENMTLKLTLTGLLVSSASRAVHVTSVVPIGNIDPDG